MTALGCTETESAKSPAWRACVLAFFACLACLRAYVFACLACLAFLRAYVLLCLVCLRGWRDYTLSMLASLRAWCACVRACVLVTMKCFIFLRVCALSVLFCFICFTFRNLNLKILIAKKNFAFSSWTYFLFKFWYQLIKLYETNLRVAGKSINV